MGGMDKQMSRGEWALYLWEYEGGPFDGLGSSSSRSVPDEIAPNDHPGGSYVLDPDRHGTNGVAVLVWFERDHAATA
jgi:hypothetical protein